MLVAVYAPWLHLLFPLLMTCLDIGLDQVHVASLVVDTQVRTCTPIVQKMEEGIILVLLINVERIDTFETEMAQEQSVRKHARNPIPNLKNQHLNQVIPTPLSSLMMISNILNQLSCCPDCPG